ncbi:SBBP repeat-containing protein [Pontibacter mangrovi]|uniref:T9SS type A sorting domain-containing protein n=1 Tax=Pontibacter mangrovi TaxID=2589816 RepID=A0A501W4P1_9BACT|nr:SBBP repeat-containing protein [Pontibacter mangrovi]TPE43260.1 T9SS type A sorting domain-containing protein [Pontibacter mangrovi]
MKKLILCALVFLCGTCSIATYAQQPTVEWAQRYNSIDTVSTNDKAVAIATDAQGNVYITGNSQGVSPVNMITLKYSPSGQLLWKYAYDADDIVQANDIAIDNQGGVYLLGTYSAMNSDFITIRLDAQTGQQSWVQQFNGPSNRNDQPAAITTDNSGGVYVTGTSESNQTEFNIVTIRYEALTGNKTWDMEYSGPGFGSSGADLATDNNGSVYVIGTSINPDAFSRDMVTIRYEAATGAELWAIRYSNKELENGDLAYGRSIAIDSNGMVYVAGSSYGTDAGVNYVAISYDAAGTQRWLSRYNYQPGVYSTDEAAIIAVDNQGGVFVTGSSGSAMATVGFNAQTGAQVWDSRYENFRFIPVYPKGLAADNTGGVYVTGVSMDDFVTIRYNALDGRQEWEKVFDSSQQPNSDEPAGLALDNQGRLYVTGNSVELGVDEKSDIVTIAYESGTGDSLWTQTYDGSGSFPTTDRPVAVAVDADGNSYVTGTSESENRSTLTTVKYSPAGDSLWAVHYGETGFKIAVANAIDNQGNLYVTGTSNDKSINGDIDIITIRYDAATGQVIWASLYDVVVDEYTEERAAGLAVDKNGNIYVAGTSRNYLSNTMEDIVVIRYDTATGDTLWVSRYDAGLAGANEDRAVAITTDPGGAVYVAGNTSNYDNESSSDFITIRFEAENGTKKWEKRFDSGEGSRHDVVAAIAADAQGGLYVTGAGDEGYTTIRYQTATGQEVWRSKPIDTAVNFNTPTAMAVDGRGGVYVTGLAYNSSTFTDFGTVRYDAATGDLDWAKTYNYTGGNGDWATALTVDSVGGVYVTGYSQTDQMGSIYSTVKYNGDNGDQVWAEQTAGPSDFPTVIATDPQGNIVVTGYSMNTSIDFLTIKYNQPSVCLELPEVPIAGPGVARAGTNGVSYTLGGSGATNFLWQITDNEGRDYTSFSGQGTDTIRVNWASKPAVYKITATYGTTPDCPTHTAVLYVHVSDPAAGYVTGGGWSDAPANPAYELMQSDSRAYWGFVARYSNGGKLQGQVNLVLENSLINFRSTSLEEGSLVVTGNQAFFRGYGRLTRLSATGNIESDPRRFGFLIAATDVQYDSKQKDKLVNWNSNEKDQLRILIWEIDEDGTRGAVVFDNQAACAANLDENSPACQTISGGNITIHGAQFKSKQDNSLLAAELEQQLIAYPTAFQEHTTVAFTLKQQSGYTLDLYDLKGALIKRIAAGDAESGRLYEHSVQAAGLAKGFYFVRLMTDQGVQTVKILVQR